MKSKRRIPKNAYWVLLTCSVLLFIYFGLPEIIVWRFSPLDRSEADIDQNGRIGLLEMDYAVSLGKRVYVRDDGVQCTKYYALKDGADLKVVCRDE